MNAYTQQILNTTAYIFNVEVQDILSPSRARTTAHARIAACYALHRGTQQYSLSTIGNLFGHVDHTSAMHAIQRAVELARRDSEYRRKLDAVMAVADSTNAITLWIEQWDALRDGIPSEARALIERGIAQIKADL